MPTKQPAPKNLTFKLGVVLLFLASFLWVGAAIVPFTVLTIGQKAAAITALLIIAEILFWVGTVCVGKEFIAKIKSLYSVKNWKARNDK